MKLSFITICALVTVGAFIVSIFVAPIMWDAAGYIETILNNAYNVAATTSVVDCDSSVVHAPLVRAMEC